MGTVPSPANDCTLAVNFLLKSCICRAVRAISGRADWVTYDRQLSGIQFNTVQKPILAFTIEVAERNSDDKECT